jgi:ABC-type transport system involved in cytochrome c biogenesis ATPase subunit
MTQDEIIELAKQAKAIPMHKDFNQLALIGNENIEAFAKLVAEREREACAQILANTDLSGLRDHPFQNWVAGMLFEFIKAIRARGQA